MAVGVGAGAAAPAPHRSSSDDVSGGGRTGDRGNKRTRGDDQSPIADDFDHVASWLDLNREPAVSRSRRRLANRTRHQIADVNLGVCQWLPVRGDDGSADDASWRVRDDRSGGRLRRGVLRRRHGQSDHESAGGNVAHDHLDGKRCRVPFHLNIALCH